MDRSRAVGSDPPACKLLGRTRRTDRVAFRGGRIGVGGHVRVGPRGRIPQRGVVGHARDRSIPVCAAHVSFYAASMSPPGARDARTAIESRQGTHLAGLFPWDTQQGAADYGVQGVLTIEPPCVYLDNGERYLLRLARPLIRYDPETNSIWVDEHGPMTTGDEVITWGGGDSPFDGPYARTCTAAGEVFSPGLKPRDETWIE